MIQLVCVMTKTIKAFTYEYVRGHVESDHNLEAAYLLVLIVPVLILVLLLFRRKKKKVMVSHGQKHRSWRVFFCFVSIYTCIWLKVTGYTSF